MEKYHGSVSNTNSPRKDSFRERFNLPVIALFLNIVPIFLMLLMGLHLLTDSYIVLYFCLAMSFLWMGTGFGGFFHLAGIILAICYLCGKRKRPTPAGITLSVISILFPFVLWFILITFGIADMRMLP